MLKKYLYLVVVALFAALPFALTSCGDDDDEGSGSNGGSLMGTVTMKFGKLEPTTHYAYCTEWHAGHQKVTGSVLDHLKSGATFIAYFSDTKLSADDIYLFQTRHEGEMQIETPDEVKVGAEIEIDKCAYSPYPGDFDSAGYFHYDCEGKVTVKSIKGNVVTLKFDNFKFEYILKFHVGNSTFEEVVMNGEISFAVEE